MNRYTTPLILLLAIALSSCVTTRKKKDEVGWLGKKWHDMNARYNGYFNAKELYAASSESIIDEHEDNYAQILDIYQWGDPESRESVSQDMDLAIEKVTKVAALHEPSKWVDDCYVMMGKAQYLKGDLETAQETFEYFVDDFNPTDTDSRVYVSPDREQSSKDRKKQRDNERKVQEQERETQKKEKEKTRKQKEKERKQAAKQREKERKQRIKDRKKGIKRTPAPKSTASAESATSEPTPTVVASTDEEIPISQDEAYIRELEAKNAQKKEEVKPQGGFLKHRPAYYEGMLWLVKTFIARERWIEANYFLTKLETDGAVPKDIVKEVPIVRADYFLQMKDYNNALPALDHALGTSGDRKLKARMAFIKAQVYQLKGQPSMAYEAFEQVNKYNADFEMSLQAKINQIRTGWSAGKESSDKAVRQLNRMGNERKYEAYRGHIYAAAAEILLADGNKEEALVYFQKALEGDNSGTLQTEIYYRLATLFYGNQEYIVAKNYFDSTLNVMPEKDERYSLAKRFADNLSGIAANLQQIVLQDSLLALGAKSEGELQRFAETQVKENWEKQTAASGRDEIDELTASSTVLGTDSKFFAYNPTLRNKGRQDFLRKWGDRPLVDNWRLESKLQGLIEDGTVEAEIVSIPDGVLEREVNKILREIPTTTEQRQNSEAIIEQALFELGTGFRVNLEKHEESSEALLELLNRFPGTEHKPEAYFFLYLNAIDLGDTGRAENYKNRLINEFPQSDFTAYVQNPDGDDLMTDERRRELDYEKAYALFEKGQYQASFEHLMEKSAVYGEEHKLAAKYELLKAMCIGHLQGQEEYINALRSVILRFNNTPEQAHAREMLRFLRGDEDTFTGGESAEEINSKFALENEKVHYILVVLFEEVSGAEMNNAKKSINDFNEANYKTKRLRSTSLVLNKENKSQLILIRRFSGKDDGMEYYKSVVESGSDFLSTDNYSYEVFAVNQKNYRQIMRDKSVNQYRIFFEQHYFGGE